ncbi:hypothetical protein ACFV80_45730 [Streptomyces sp. NPDC059862]|uniref:hypothetical protein n=1 Tax=Streptomyces sp. NPDC059862 TaxID=3346975 RepID=UPI00365D414A
MITQRVKQRDPRIEPEPVECAVHVQGDVDLGHFWWRLSDRPCLGFHMLHGTSILIFRRR